MEQIRALNALEPFILLSKSANSPRAAADLITQATSAPQTYVFAELLDTPNIQKLQNDAEYASHHKLLEIFAWGTWSDYAKGTNDGLSQIATNAGFLRSATNGIAEQTSLPQLNAAQNQKLRLLTLMTLASTAARTSDLTYTYLLQSLALTSTRALEDLVIAAVYASLINATLSPSTARLEVHSIAPLRDCGPGSILNLSSQLATWSDRCDNTLRRLEQQMESIKTAASKRDSRTRRNQAAFEHALTLATSMRDGDLRSGKGGSNAGRGGAGGSGFPGLGNFMAPAGEKRSAEDGEAPDEDEGFGDDDAMDLDPKSAAAASAASAAGAGLIAPLASTSADAAGPSTRSSARNKRGGNNRR